MRHQLTWTLIEPDKGQEYYSARVLDLEYRVTLIGDRWLASAWSRGEHLVTDPQDHAFADDAKAFCQRNLTHEIGL